MADPERTLAPAAAPGAPAHPPAADLARYIDALGAGTTAALPGKLLDHVESCPHCQGQILDVHFHLQDPLRRPDTAWARKILAGNKRRSAWLLPSARIAAAAFAFILLSALIFFLPRPPLSDPRPGNTTRLSPAPEIPVPDQPLAGKKIGVEAGNSGAGRSPGSHANNRKGAGTDKSPAFAVNPNLESMVGSRSRSFLIEVHSPPNHVTLSGEITFAWKEFSREPLNLVIVNNRNETIFKNAAGKGVFKFHDTLSPGCYYWKLESENDLFYVGKFFIAAGPIYPKE